MPVIAMRKKVQNHIGKLISARKNRIAAANLEIETFRMATSFVLGFYFAPQTLQLHTKLNLQF
jgi:hypothetical protein